MIQFASAWLDHDENEQQAVLQAAEAQFARSGSLDDLVRVGLLAAVRGGDDRTQRVRDALRRLLEAEPAHDLAPLGRVLLGIMDEQERQVRRLAAESETLQRQLDELKAIEEQLRERGRPELIQPP